MVQLSTNSLFAVGLAVCAAVQSVAAQTSLSPGDLGQSFGTWPFTNDSAKFSLPLRVLVRPLAPYIMVNSTAPNAGAIGERYYGVAIDLWERVRTVNLSHHLVTHDRSLRSEVSLTARLQKNSTGHIHTTKSTTQHQGSRKTLSTPWWPTSTTWQ